MNQYVIDAINNDPEGTICGFCGNFNTFADDIGFFYTSPTQHLMDIPTCRVCWNGSPGKIHRKRYGLGER